MVEKLENQVLYQQLKARASDIFVATKDVDLQKRRLEVEQKVSGLNRAFETFAKFGLVSQ